jgi:major type 1 subunit fimbrin (pilin)
MKKTILTAALLTAFGVAAIASQGAIAATLPTPVSNSGPDGTITITGTVIAQTCLVDGKAAGTSDAKTVTLADVLTSDFSAVGNVAAPTAFNIAITGCNAALSTVQAFFTGANIDTTTGNLKNTAASGSNVEVQLLNASNVAMPLNGANATAQNSQTVTLTSGAATLNYSAQYIATAAATSAGGVNTAVNFTLIYQ